MNCHTLDTETFEQRVVSHQPRASNSFIAINAVVGENVLGLRTSVFQDCCCCYTMLLNDCLYSLLSSQ